MLACHNGSFRGKTRYSLVFLKILALNCYDLTNNWVWLLKIDNCLFGFLGIENLQKSLVKRNPQGELRLSFRFI
jgi:hypothetical protein